LARRQAIVALDIGTTKVVTLVGEVAPLGDVNIVGVGVGPSTGMRKGIVVDIDGTVKSIQSAVDSARRMSGLDIRSVFLGVGGSHITSLRNKGVVAVNRDDREITRADVERVLEAARVISIPPDREIIHVLPRGYTVDGHDGIRDPEGMVGIRLEVEAGIITASVTSLQNLLRSVYKSGLDVDDVVLNPLASGEAVLQAAEKELGVVVADIGGGTTGVALFDEGSLWFSSIVPVAGSHITGDLAVGLRTPIAEAERAKMEYGVALEEMAAEGETFQIAGISGGRMKEAPLGEIAAIIEPRAHEIVTMIGQEIKRSSFGKVIPGGLVLTGGTSLLRGLGDLAEKYLEMPVRVGLPRGVGGLTDVARHPGYSTAVGILIHAARNLDSAGERPVSGRVGGLWQRIGGFFRGMF
jgi:cell division protein FtsA